MSRFSIGSGSWHCNIAELHGLVNIRPELSITGLKRASSVDDAQTANLVSKQHLLKLTLDWADGFGLVDADIIPEFNMTLYVHPSLRRQFLRTFGHIAI